MAKSELDYDGGPVRPPQNYSKPGYYRVSNSDGAVDDKRYRWFDGTSWSGPGVSTFWRFIGEFLVRLGAGPETVQTLAMMFAGTAVIVVIILLWVVIAGLVSGEQKDSAAAGGPCVGAELDLAPGAPDPCASSTTNGSNPATAPPGDSSEEGSLPNQPTTAATLPPDTGTAVGEFTTGRIIDPGPLDWATSYDYQVLDNHLTFSILPSEDGETAEALGYGEVTVRHEYETEQFPDSDKEGTVRRLFTAVTVFELVGTWDGDSPGLVEGTVTWNVPADRLDVEYNESTVGTYLLTDGIFTGLGPPGGVFTATYSPTTGGLIGEVTVDPWGVLGFRAVAHIVEP